MSDTTNTVQNNSELNVYNIMQQQLEETFSAPDAGAFQNDGLEGNAYRLTVLRGFVTENREMLCVCGIFMLCAIHLFLRLLFYGIGVVRIDTGYTTGSLASCIAATLIPLLNWVYSTKIKAFSFHNRKLFLLRFCMATFSVMMMTFIYHHIGNILIPLVVTLFQPTVSRSVSMVKMFCRGLMLLASCVPGVGLYVLTSRFTRDEIYQYEIINFDVSMKIDLRDPTTREFAYDMVIVKDLKHAQPYVIKEKDRFLHALDDGATGSGKTSSTFTPAINNDFHQRMYNMEHQKMGVEKLLAEGQVRIAHPMDDAEFDIDNFIPLTKKAEKKLYDLKYKSPLAGIIAIAPNESFSDEIYSLAQANGQRVNRIDPMLSPDGRLKEGFVGMNPIYIKPGRSGVKYLIEVNQRATLFADVLQSVFERSGQTNPYFSGLNQNITTSVTAIILLCAPYMPEKFADRGVVPTPADVQDLLNDFSKAKEYDKVFTNYYAKPGTKYNGQPDFGNLQYIYDVVHGRLLGADSSQLFDQCQGLRNIINQLLSNPMLRNVLCAQNTINLDRALAKGEIILVNYALDLGSDGITFGIFFLLSLINAAYRRPAPEKERLPVFIYVDELPQLLHPKLEACFSLFRQYRMAMFVAIQSLSQLTKTRETTFLQQVLLGNCAHHFVFGRAGVEDMEVYMTLAGTRLKSVLTESRNETSLLAANPSVSYQHRFTNQRVNNIEGSDIHDLKFQECLLITVNDGTPVTAFAAMVFFLPRWQRTRHRRYEVDWSRYYALQDGFEDDPQEAVSADASPAEDDSIVTIPRQTFSTDTVDSANTVASAIGAGMFEKSDDSGKEIPASESPRHGLHDELDSDDTTDQPAADHSRADDSKTGMYLFSPGRSVPAAAADTGTSDRPDAPEYPEQDSDGGASPSEDVYVQELIPTEVPMPDLLIDTGNDQVNCGENADDSWNATAGTTFADTSDIPDEEYPAYSASVLSAEADVLQTPAASIQSDDHAPMPEAGSPDTSPMPYTTSGPETDASVRDVSPAASAAPAGTDTQDAEHHPMQTGKKHSPKKKKKIKDHPQNPMPAATGSFGDEEISRHLDDISDLFGGFL